MASARKCNRCGKYYESGKNNGNKKDVRGIAIIKENGGAVEIIDLCPECMKEVKKVLRKKME